MESAARKLAFVTSLGKKYSGMVDVPNETFRTTDLVNGVNIFWKDTNEKIYDDAILLRDARLYLDDAAVYKKYEKIQIRINEIIYLYDDVETICDEMEKKRAASVAHNVEVFQNVNIITRPVANSFYEISGILAGFYKKKAKDAFIPLTQADIYEISKKPEKWTKRRISLAHNYICVNNRHVESVFLV